MRQWIAGRDDKLIIYQVKLLLPPAAAVFSRSAFGALCIFSGGRGLRRRCPSEFEGHAPFHIVGVQIP